MAVIAHDFDDITETANTSRMSSFRHRQPTTFETTNLAFTCGKIGKELAIRREDLNRLIKFFEEARNEPEDMEPDTNKFTQTLASLLPDAISNRLFRKSKWIRILIPLEC